MPFLVVNTKYRDTPSDPSTNCSIVLKEPVTASSFRLMNCYLPNSMYNVYTGRVDGSESGEVFAWSRVGDTGYAISLTDGNYDIDTLCQTLQDTMNATQVAAGLTGATASNYTCTYDNERQRVIWTSDFNFNIVDNTINDLLGVTVVPSPTGTSLAADTCPQLYSPLSLLLNIDGLGKNITNPFGTVGTFYLPLTVAKGSLNLVDINNSLQNQVIKNSYPKTLSRISLRLLHHDGTLVDLGNSDWEFVLEYTD